MSSCSEIAVTPTICAQNLKIFVQTLELHKISQSLGRENVQDYPKVGKFLTIATQLEINKNIIHYTLKCKQLVKLFWL